MRSQESASEVDGETLGQTAIFEGLPSDVLSELARLFWRESYPLGSTIFSEGDPADRAFLLREGSVTLSVAPSSLPEPLDTTVLVPPRSGQAFGWSSALGTGRHSVTAVATTAVRVLAADPGALLAYLDRHPVTGYTVMRRLARVLSHRLAIMRSLALATVCD